VTWCEPGTDGVILRVKVVPRAPRTQVAGEMGDRLRIRLAAPPVEGRANEALVEFLADRLEVPRRDVEILSGETGRLKRVRVRGITREKALSLKGKGRIGR